MYGQFAYSHRDWIVTSGSPLARVLGLSLIKRKIVAHEMLKTQIEFEWFSCSSLSICCFFSLFVLINRRKCEDYGNFLRELHKREDKSGYALFTRMLVKSY